MTIRDMKQMMCENISTKRMNDSQRMPTHQGIKKIFTASSSDIRSMVNRGRRGIIDANFSATARDFIFIERSINHLERQL